jgi:nicotinic acid mononucleotide adenylyltransferase
VIPRPEVALDDGLPAPMAQAWQARHIDDPQGLRSRIAGSIYVQPVSPQPISSTAIRAALGEGHPVEIAGLLPPAVLAYIQSNGLYTQPTHAS